MRDRRRRQRASHTPALAWELPELFAGQVHMLRVNINPAANVAPDHDQKKQGFGMDI